MGARMCYNLNIPQGGIKRRGNNMEKHEHTKAVLYAINSPLSKLLLDYMPSTLMAGFLYIGAWLCANDEPIFKKRK